MNSMLVAIVTLGLMGLIFAYLLGVVSEKYAVEIDDTVQKIQDALPGANCGACGYPGCPGCAAAIAKGDAPTNACVIGGASVAEEVAKVLGVAASASDDKKVALVKCNGDCESAAGKYQYHGINSCAAQASFFGGAKACAYGCLGCGDCVDACEFDAIHVINGVAKVDRDKCVACGMCVKACPKDIIELVPIKQRAAVICKSHDKGKDVRGKCKVGCIGCTICAKTYPEGFTMDNFLSVETLGNDLDLDLQKEAAQKCPSKCIEIFE